MEELAHCWESHQAVIMMWLQQLIIWEDSHQSLIMWYGSGPMAGGGGLEMVVAMRLAHLPLLFCQLERFLK